MKKILAFLLSFSLVLPLLFSCGDESAVRVGVMSGPTGMGLSHMMAEEAENERYDFSVYADPSVGMTDLLGGNLDLLCLPTNTAAALYAKSSGNIRIVAVNCLSSLFVLAKKSANIHSIADLAGKTVVTAVPSSTTKPIVDALLSAAQVTATVEVESTIDALVARVAQGTAEIAVLPEPKASAALSKNADYERALDVGTLWGGLIGAGPAMGCIVATKEFTEKHAAQLTSFLEKAAASTRFVTNAQNAEDAAAEVVGAGILPSTAVASSALENLRAQIVFLTGAQMQSAYSDFLTQINVSVPDSDFFWSK